MQLSKLILGLGILATCSGQTSYTATPLNLPFDSANLVWISDDARSGFGFGLSANPFNLQCFFYQDGTVTVIPTPGVYCQVEGANTGIAVLRLNTPGDWVDTQLAIYQSGRITPLVLPDQVNVVGPTTITVNKKGQMAGTFGCPAAPALAPSISMLCAFSISGDGTFTRLPDLGGYGAATAIGDTGDIVGYVVMPREDPLSGRRAVLWPHTGGMKDLTTLTSVKLGTPVAINSKGQIAGTSPYLSGGPFIPGIGYTYIGQSGPGFFYDGSATFTPILPNGASYVNPVSLNDRGEVIGNYRIPQGNSLDYPFYYTSGTAKDMNTALANLPVNLYLSGPAYINNAGQMLVSAVVASTPVGVIANGTGQKQYLISPSNAPVSPAIGSVVNGYSHLPGLASATWVQLLGQNLSLTTRMWNSSDISGNKLPTSLDGVSVTVNGLPAYPEFISPTQIFFLAPDDAVTGPVQVQVTNAQGVSTPFTVTKSDSMPALMTGSLLAPGPGVFAAAVATHANGTPVCLPIGSGCNGTPALAGEIISLFGTGFGATKPPTQASDVVTTPVPLANPVTVTIGGKTATVTFAGRVASGEDQINVTIPEGLPPGNSLIVATENGLSTQSGVTLILGPIQTQ